MKEKIKKLIQKIKNAFKSKNDALGSYTGQTEDGKPPTQDAEDL